MVENGFVLLTDTTFNLQQLINDLEGTWQLTLEDIELQYGSLMFSVGNISCVMSVMPAPIPNGEAEMFAQGNYYCQDAVDIAKAHKAHLMVIVTDLSVDKSDDKVSNIAIEGMALYSKIIACSLSQESATGVYTSGTVFNADFYIKTCEQYLKSGVTIEVPVMIWVFVGLVQTETGNQLYTVGLEKFDKAELEILNNKENPQSLLTMMITMCSHIINTNMVMKDGETFGFSAEQQWAISHSASVYARSEYSLKLKVSEHPLIKRLRNIGKPTIAVVNLDAVVADSSDKFDSFDSPIDESIDTEQPNEQNRHSQNHLNDNPSSNTDNQHTYNNRQTERNSNNQNSTNGYITFFALVAGFFAISTAVFGYLYYTNQTENKQPESQPQFASMDELQEFSGNNIGEGFSSPDMPSADFTQQVSQKPSDIRNRGLPASYFLADIKETHPDVVALYAGTYEPNGNQAIIDVPYTDKPVVLYLSSYHKVSWKLNYINNVENPEKKTNVVGVVYSSDEEGTKVDGISSDIVFDSFQDLGGYKAFNNKGIPLCVGGIFHYEDSDVIQDIAKLQKNYGIKVLDFAGVYSVTHLSFQNINNPINFAVIATKNYNEIESLRKKCSARANPNYETTYQDVERQDTTSHKSEIIFHDDASSYPIKTNPNIDNLDLDKHLYKFPLTTTTWGDYLNPQHKVPNKGFMAYYINSDSPTNIVKKIQTSDIQQKYSYDEFLGIPSENFNAYWVGVLKAPKSEFYSILMNQNSIGGGRVSIDRRVILEKGNLKDKVFIPKGNHIIEVEYSNNWHTTDVQVVIEPLSSVKQPTDPTDFLAKIKLQHPNVVALFAGVHEANNKAIALDIPRSKVPVVLYLGSYDSINWQISNPNNTNIAGVVFGSHIAGTKVQGISEDKVVNIGKQFGGYKTKGACEPTGSSPFNKYDIPVVEYVSKHSTDYLTFKAVSGKCS